MIRIHRGGRGRLVQHGQTSKLVTVLGNFRQKATFAAGGDTSNEKEISRRQDVTAESGECAESDAALEAE